MYALIISEFSLIERSVKSSVTACLDLIKSKEESLCLFVVTVSYGDFVLRKLASSSISRLTNPNIQRKAIPERGVALKRVNPISRKSYAFGN